MNPSCKKVKGGWRIQLLTGKIFPRLYKKLAECQVRVDQLNRHTDLEKPKRPKK